MVRVARVSPLIPQQPQRKAKKEGMKERIMLSGMSTGKVQYLPPHRTAAQKVHARLATHIM